jgi:predicted enzyme related to lactoylglutathione lyase
MGEVKAAPVKGRVTGVGGVFLRARDPKALTDWYHQHLGFPVTAYGVSFEWTDEVPKGTGTTAWSTFPDNTDYFGKGSRQAVMINYRVDDMDALLAKLKAANVPIDPHRDDASYGRFAWITDPEGNRVELWQPIA